MSVPSDVRFVALMELAAKQDGWFTTEQLLGARLRSAVVGRMTDSGLLQRDQRGLYRVAGLQLETERRVVPAVLVARGVVSHRSATEQFGIGRSLPGKVEVTVGGGRCPRSRGDLIVHRARSLAEDEVTRIGWLPVTTPERTLLDLAAPAYRMRDEQLGKALDRALGQKLVTAGGLRSYLELKGKRVPGVRRLKAMLAEADTTGFDSHAEKELFELLLASGLPRPETQHVVKDDRHQFLARVDFAWPARKVALEMDGYGPHSEPEVFDSDRARGNLIVDAGWTLLRTTPRNLRKQSHEIVASVAAALNR